MTEQQWRDLASTDCETISLQAAKIDELTIQCAVLTAQRDALLNVARNAAASIGALYELLERVEKAGGATSIPGVAACHTMLTRMRKNAGRLETLVMSPLRTAIAAAEDKT